MTVLITGGAGYIGSHMVYELSGRGEPIVILDDLSTGFSQNLPADAPLIVGDYGNPDLLRKVIGEHNVTAIMHFAGSVIVPESMQQPLRYYLNNTANTRTLIEAAIEGGVAGFIFSSTAAVYGPTAESLVAEDAPTEPISPYGRSKLMSELMLRDANSAHKLKFVILRYFNVAGADPSLRTGQSSPFATHLISVAVQAALGLRSTIDVYGTDYPTADGTCIRDYIHVTDLVRAHVDALRYLRQGGEPVTLNCGYGRGVSVYEVIEAVKRNSGTGIHVQKAARRAGDSPMVVASPARIRSILGWKPRFDDLDVIVRHAYAWQKEHMARNP